MSRTLADIQSEYNRAATELGAETYKIHALEVEIDDTVLKIDQLKKKMLHLNKEAGRLAAKQTEPASEAEPVALPEVANEQP